MASKLQEKLGELLALASSEISAGNCNLSDDESLRILEALIQAKLRTSSRQDNPDLSLLHRLEEGFCHLSDKVDKLEEEQKKGGHAGLHKV